MNKIAELAETQSTFLSDHQPLELLMSGLGIGAGGYSAIRLLNEALRNPDDAIEADKKDRLEVELPHPQVMPQQKEGTDKWYQNDLVKGLSLGAGIPLGVLATDALYRKLKSTEMDDDIERENKKRTELMQRVKTSGETPMVDELCAGIAEGLVKSSEGSKLSDTWEGIKDTGAGLIGDVGSLFIGPNGLQSNANARETVGTRFGSEQMHNATGLSAAEKALLGAAAIGVLGVGGTMAASYSKKRNKEQNTPIPPGVDFV